MTNRPIPIKPDNGAQLPEHRAKQVEAGLSAYQAIATERDMLDRQLKDATARIDSMNQQLASLQGVINMMESAYLSAKADLEGRVREYQQQRDLSVARVARLEAILVSCAQLLNSEMQLVAHDGS